MSASSRRTSQRWFRLALLVGVFSLAGCRQDMHDQAKYEPLEGSALFADGASARPVPAHTVARGNLRADRALYTGLATDGGWVADLPVELTPELLARGRERFEIFCSPCHDRTGSGRGMIVQRGFLQPPRYWDPRLLEKPIGYFFDVATNGYGQMSGYGAQVPTEDRWAIAAWIRVLQRARTVDATGLGAEERGWVEEGHRVGSAEGAAAHGISKSDNGGGEHAAGMGSK